MAKKERLVLVDGSAVFHRGYHAIPPLSNAAGVPTNATYGFTTMLLKVLQDLKPKYAIVAWDKSGDTFRKEIYPEYKAHRKKQPDDLYAQMPYARQVTEALGLPWIELQGYEADDIIGTLARTAEKQGLENIIVTGDLDELQLIDDNTHVYTMRRGFTDTFIYDRDAMMERYGLTPEQFVDYKALKGDASDNIPGVEGVGEKTAVDLIKTHGSLDGVYKNLDQIKGKLRERLEANKEIAYLSHKLSEIACDAPVGLELPPAEVGRFDRQRVHELFRQLEFKSLLDKLPPELVASKKNAGELTLFDDEPAPAKQRPHLEGVKYQAITNQKQLDELVGRLEKCQQFAFDTETDSVDEISAGLVGISVSLKEGEAYYIPVGHAEGSQLDLDHVCSSLKAAFENPKIGKIAHNAKFDYKILARHGILARPIVFDTMIAAFILNPMGRSASLDDLVFREFGIEMIPLAELIGKGRNQITFGQVELEPATDYAAEDADMTWRLYQAMAPQMKQQGFDRLAEATEWPLVSVLGNMELAGVALDVEFLKQFNKTLSRDILKLEERIAKEAGERFNINSPAQLSHILFNKLGLVAQGVRRGKTGGLSTAARELEKLRDAHPVVSLIMEYRELVKLKTTYVDALPQMVAADGRVHTTYSQTIAQTGRLSSNNPNLQNIPIRTELGREIRKAFVAPPGRVLVSADYSQIELRVAAALSQDQDMIETFKKGVDLHAQTAAEMFGIALDKVTKEQRYAAKTINFGVLYGMSPHGLSVATGMGRDEAAAFIERYFDIRQSLRGYIENTKKFARENEYTETLFGRRRPCPEINSNNYIMANAAERMAVNVPIQGTAADIMKLAMIALEPKLPQGAQMLLQIHDQLIVECDEKQAKEVSKILKETMEQVYDLGVPIVADTSVGKSWGDL